MKQIVEHLRLLVPSAEGGPTDGQLLGRFVAGRDQGAFALLVRRHGSMVLGVCRRLLGHEQDAEDAFQATFLILARKAASIVRCESVGAWLHAVACRAALEARAANIRRRAKETAMPDPPHPQAPPAEPQDWLPLLDQELCRLPEKYRKAIVLADLEGHTRREMARLLGVPVGTVNSRLATARTMLAGRLIRRGVTLPAGVLAAVLAVSRATACVSAARALETAEAAVQFAAGQAAVLATPAAALTKGVFKAMLVTKLKVLVATFMVTVAVGLGGLGYQATVGTAPAHAAAQKPTADANLKAELEALRKENDLLRRSLELALDKIKTQEAELRTLRDAKKEVAPGPGPGPFGPGGPGPGGPKGPANPSARSDRLKAIADGETIRIFDVGSGKEIISWKKAGNVTALVFTRDAKMLVSGSKDEKVRCWDVSTGKLVWEHEFSKRIVHVEVSASGKSVAVADDEKTGYVLDIRTGELLKQLGPRP
jgi:RNA polymerase sigma factor (sigma-70 family)